MRTIFQTLIFSISCLPSPLHCKKIHALSTLHIRSEQFDGGYTGGTGSDPVNKVRIDASPQIFPGIIFKDGRAQLLESVGLEQDYNGLKNGITDLDLRIGQVGQLQDLLKLARGIPL